MTRKTRRKTDRSRSGRADVAAARARKPRLTHLDARGQARMVDVGQKNATQRVAVASAVVEVGRTALRLVLEGRMPKGDVLAVARIAGIAAAKRTSELIPLCHPLPIESVEVQIEPSPPAALRITATTRLTGKTGVEMEALTAASVAALAVYDMCKSVTRDIRIGPVQLESKTGGKSGAYRRR